MVPFICFLIPKNFPSISCTETENTWSKVTSWVDSKPSVGSKCHCNLNFPLSQVSLSVINTMLIILPARTGTTPVGIWWRLSVIKQTNPDSIAVPMICNKPSLYLICPWSIYLLRQQKLSQPQPQLVTKVWRSLHCGVWPICRVRARVFLALCE